MKKHRFVIALVGLSLFAASSTIAADMTQANMDQHSVTYTIKGDGLVIFDKIEPIEQNQPLLPIKELSPPMHQRPALKRSGHWLTTRIIALPAKLK